MNANTLHYRIIQEIHKYDAEGTPFAIHELVRATHVSRSSTIRILSKLVDIGMVLHSVTAFRGRHYRTSLRWNGVEDVAKEYEMALLMKI